MKNNLVKQSRQRGRPQNRWTKSQTETLLEVILDKVKDDPQKFEKPTATIFYDHLFQKEELVEFREMGVGVIKNKMRNLRDIFIKAETWKKQTGAGLLEIGEERSVKDYINRKCPHYDLLNGIFGQRKTVNLPFTYDTEEGMVEFLLEDDDCAENMVEDSEVIENNNLNMTALSDDIACSGEPTPKKQCLEKFKSALKCPSTKSTKSAANFISAVAQGRNEIEKERLELEKDNSNYAKEVDSRKHEFEKQKLEFQQTLELSKLEFEKEKFQKEFELKQKEKENEFQLKKFELELKYKYNNVHM